MAWIAQKCCFWGLMFFFWAPKKKRFKCGPFHVDLPCSFCCKITGGHVVEPPAPLHQEGTRPPIGFMGCTVVFY